MLFALLAAALLAAAVPGWAAVDDLPCVVCHPSRDRAAFEILSDMPGVSIRSESAQAFVCYSCHNGSVVDSRAALTRGGQHPSGLIPARTPAKELPLYPGGRIECGTCHSPHGTGPGAKRWLRTADDGATLCSACHAGRTEPHMGLRLTPEDLKAVQRLGGKAGEGGRIACSTCHRLHGAGGPSLLLAPYAAGREELCLLCHPSAGAKTAPSAAVSGHPCAACHAVHAPRGELPAARCESCHRGHVERHLGRALGPDAAKWTLGLGGKTGAGGKIVCSTCHKVHGPAGTALLLAPHGPPAEEFCRGCHSGMSVKGEPPGPRSQPCGDCHKPHTDAPFQFPPASGSPCQRCHPSSARPGADHPAASSACSDCHSVHHPVLLGGQKAGLLRMPVAGGLLCQGCHPNPQSLHGPGTRAPEEARSRLAARGVKLGPSGEMECSSCHTMHGAAQGHLLRTPRLLLCLYCHARENPYGPEGEKPGTHPVGVFLRRSQRKLLEMPGLGVAAGETLECSSCHNAHRMTLAQPSCTGCHSVQAPAENHGGLGGCSACHSIHGGGAPNLACARCHQGVKSGPHPERVALRGAPLPAVDAAGRTVFSGELGCATCHDPHGASPKLLRKKTAGDTCVECHTDKKAMLGGSHDGLRKGKDSPCAPCHSAHAAPTATRDDPVETLCKTCHPGDLRTLRDHGPAGTPVWKRVAGALPLFDRGGRRNPLGFVSCGTCHDVHKGPAHDSLRLQMKDQPKLCLACHPEKRALLGSRHDPRSSSGGAACTVCHPVHSKGEVPPLWTLRAQAQGTWNDRKCSPCHGPPGGAPLRHAGSDSHPVNVNLPQEMRQPGLPLYDATGGRAGRVLACSTCHDIHGRENAPGVVIANFLRKDPARNDLCAGCHPREASLAGTPHDLRSRWPSAGVPCGPCHVPHRALSPQALWGLQPGPSEYSPNARCRSCHRMAGPVQSQFLLLQYHMKDAETLRTPRRSIYLQYPSTLLDEWAVKTGKAPVIPLFDKQGNAGPEGNLQCVSCHDPHVWSPLGDFVKPGFGALGPNVATHFLRLRDTEPVTRSVCAVCHAKDSVDKYLHYHHVWEDLEPGSP